ncbi:putative transmembrane protein [Gregarina niphandrodes]|uniref:Transmembrane protein n=1 Tax=Gregarina niphandrodes TaxID=110365 RepID=A0A023B3M2_GRENI|nr:putative transmembrane protein [Gregarina niphandrodes]EZG55602.1 putative transmembrane protein [Gregarina niphandrodes]|eukprot:XP_011131487.1 putative transmembrane protein [Gregarina niphandrodes]
MDRNRSGVADGFHQFDEIEETDVNMIHLQSPRRPVVATRAQVVIHTLDVTLGQLNLLNVWRFAAVAIPMSFRWTTGTFSAINFIVPYLISIVFLSWPLYLFETGIGQATGGENTRAMGSLSLKSRVSSLNWLLSACFLLFTAPLTAYTFVYVWEASSRWANYESPGLTAMDAVDLYVGRTCTRYSDYVPHLSPFLCGPEGRRLDVSCYDESQCHLWAGNGRCLAVPWAPASEFLFTSVEEYDPLLDQDYPQYCAARFLHDVSTNNAKAVMNASGYYRDWRGKFRARLPVSLLSTFIFACCMSVLNSLGSLGSQFGVICKATSSIVRSLFGFMGLLGLLMLTIKAMLWWKDSPAYLYNWNQGLVDFSWERFFYPDVWAFAIIQAFLTLRLGTGQNELVASRAPNKAKNLIVQCGIGAFLQTLMCFLAFLLCWFAYGTAAARIGYTGEPEQMYATLRFDIRNMPYGTLFTSVQTMFDNGPALDGATPRSVAWSRFFWICMALLGVNGVTHAVDTVTGAGALSSMNWKVGVPRWVWAIVTSVLLFLFTIPQWFGGSWGWTISHHHFLTNWAYSAMMVYEGVSVGWMVGHDLRTKHFGKAFTYLQVSCFIGGALIAAFCVAATWKYAPLWAPLLGLGIGLLCMILSFILPFPFLQTHDAYGRRHERSESVRMVVFGSADHVRKELNFRCNHSHKIWRMTALSTLAVRYGITSASLLAFANMSSYLDNVWHFSPYTPFNFNYVDQFMVVQTLMEKFDLIRAPGYVIGIAAWYALMFVIIPPLFYVYPKFLDWLIPYNTDENFFQVNEAVERFADTTNVLTEAPFTFQEQLEPIVQASVMRGSRAIQPPSTSTALPSQQVRLDPVDANEDLSEGSNYQ